MGTATPAGTTAPSGALAPGISDTEILLGAEVILSGDLGAVFATIPKATNAYFNYINETQGGVCGRKIVYQYEDNFDDPSRAVEVARKLVEQDKVFAMVGSLGDAPHPASWEYLNEKGVPDILVSAGGHRFGADPQGHPWTVQMIPSYTVEGTFFGQYISENLPGKTVAVLWENDNVGIDGLAGLKKGLDPSKNQIVAEESYRIHGHLHRLPGRQPEEVRRGGGRPSQHPWLRLPGHQDRGPNGLAPPVVHRLHQRR